MSQSNQLGGDFYNGIEWMACWLLDNAEGETITEEQLRPWAVEAWKAHLTRAAQPENEKEVMTTEKPTINRDSRQALSVQDLSGVQSVGPVNAGAAQSEQNTQRPSEICEFCDPAGYVHHHNYCPNNPRNKPSPQTEAVDVNFKWCVNLAEEILGTSGNSSEGACYATACASKLIEKAITPLTNRISQLEKANRKLADTVIGWSQLVERAEAAEARVKELERDKERLLNVLEHCALPSSVRPSNQHEVAASVVKEYRAAMQQNPQEKGTT